MTGPFRCALTLGLLAGIGAPLRAQLLKEHTFGALAGLSLNKAAGEDLSGVNTQYLTGIAVGGFLTLSFGRVVALEPQLLMVEKGIKAEEGGVTASAKLSYFQLPLLLKLRFGLRPGGGLTGYVYGGPAVAYRVGCRFKLAAEGNELAGGCENDEEASNLKKFDSSVIMGIGADVGERATFTIRYDLGLTRLDDGPEQNDIKNRAIIIMGGVRMRMNP
jgi:hypothetical protein